METNGPSIPIRQYQEVRKDFAEKVTDAILHRLRSLSAGRTATGGAYLDVPAGPNRIGSVNTLSTWVVLERTNGSNYKQ